MAKTQKTAPATPKQIDLQTLATTEEGKALIQMAADFRTKCTELNLPASVQIGGVAPFADVIIEQSKAQGFMEGRNYERLQHAYSHVIEASK